VSIWLVRAGKAGENDGFCLENSLSVIGWEEIGDMSPYTDWDSFVHFVEVNYPGLRKGTITNYSGQLFAFAHRIQIGDLICLPLKTTKMIAIGRVVSGYQFSQDAVKSQRHSRQVEWLRTDVARAAIKQDLLYSLGAFMTVCEIKRNDAQNRIEEIVRTGIDPGSRATVNVVAEQVDADTEIEAVDLVETASDRIRQYIAEEFAGHDLAQLTAAVLTAEGFNCIVSPEGPDGGIDILAGRGPLGLDSPRLLVQVKSGTTSIDAPTVRQLHGVISTHGADQGLLVAWGGLNRVAAKELATQRFNLRVWDANDLIESIFKNYAALPPAIKSRLPLRQIWILEEEA